MTWLARFLYFLFVVVLLKAVLSVFFPGRQSNPATGARSRHPTPRGSGTRMVRDPHCGMYLEPSLAVRQKTQGEVLYFCSEKCRDQHLRLMADSQAGRSGVP